MEILVIALSAAVIWIGAGIYAPTLMKNNLDYEKKLYNIRAYGSEDGPNQPTSNGDITL